MEGCRFRVALSAGFPKLGIGFAGVALAFGLTLLTVAYTIGPNSGCHINPAAVGFAGIAIGLALTLIHLISIPVDNTSVNPARSTGPAIFAGAAELSQLWLSGALPSSVRSSPVLFIKHYSSARPATSR